MRRMVFLLSLFALTGCAEIQYLDEALTLKGYSDEKDAQENFVRTHEARFEALLRATALPEPFKACPDKTSVVAAFGDPILCRKEGMLERCLYRRMVKPMTSPKVYFHFDPEGRLVRWEKR